jgi:hypothetical protein
MMKVCGHTEFVPGCKQCTLLARWLEQKEKPKPEPPRARPVGIGDKVEQALTAVGITSERVSAWLGKPCNCKERREKLNQIGAWASRVLGGAKDRATEYLNKIIGE